MANTGESVCATCPIARGVNEEAVFLRSNLCLQEPGTNDCPKALLNFARGELTQAIIYAQVGAELREANRKIDNVNKAGAQIIRIAELKAAEATK